MYLCLGKIQFTETCEKEQRYFKKKISCFVLFFNLNPFSSNNTPLYIVHVLGGKQLNHFCSMHYNSFYLFKS